MNIQTEPRNNHRWNGANGKIISIDLDHNVVHVKLWSKRIAYAPRFVGAEVGMRVWVEIVDPETREARIL